VGDSGPAQPVGEADNRRVTFARTDTSDAPPTRSRARWWLGLGRIATLAAIVSCLLLQWINHDWFPPEISVSQYGLGPRGWVFSCWCALLALSVLALAAGGSQWGAPPARSVYGCLLAGSVGLLVMGVIRTDAGGAQQSWHARAHMIGSILALVTLPVGILLAMRWATRPLRRAALALATISAGALLLVLASAMGAATPGMDAEQSWAFWQAVAVTVDMLLVGSFALAGGAARGAGSRVPDRR